MKSTIILTFLALLAGCTTPRIMTEREYQERPQLEESLFRGDQDFVHEDAVQRILTSKIQLPSKAKIALFKYEGTEEERVASTYYGFYYWRSESYMKTQQELVDTLQSLLLSSGRIAEAATMPSLLVPKQPTISMLRQAAVRLQADLVLVYRITSDTYYDFHLFRKDEVKAYSTCEALLFDTRTGIIPFTSISTRDTLAIRLPSDIDRDDATRRVQRVSALKAISSTGEDLQAFLKSIQ
jgi:hypothetical protein